MAQHDQVIDNGPGLAFRTDVNAALAALFSQSSGPIEPGVTVAGQPWFDTSNPAGGRLWLRNLGNTAWISMFDGVQAAIDISAGKRAAPDRFVWNDAINLSGADVMTLSDAGALTLIGGLIDPVFVPSAALANKATLNLSALTAPRAIRVPDSDTCTGKWEPIGDLIDLSGKTIVDWISLIAFRRLRLTLEAYLSSATFVVVRTSSNNGTSFLAGASDYRNALLVQAGTTVGGFSAADASSLFLTAGTSDAGNAINSTAEISYFNKPFTPFLKADTEYSAASALRREWNYGFQSTQANTPRNALRLTLSAGTFLHGIALLEGIRG